MNAIAASKLFSENMSTIKKEYTRLKDRALYGGSQELSEAEKSIITAYEERLIPAVIKVTKLSIEAKAMKEGWYEENEIRNYIEELEKTLSPLDPQKVEKRRKKVDMLCPSCKTNLVYVRSSSYETLGEHIFSPNDYVSVKDGYGCPNTKCEAHTHGITWLSDGEGPYGLESDKVSYIDDNKAPFRTWHRKHNAEQPTEIFRIWVGKIMLVVKMSTKADLDGKKSLLKRRFDFEVYINQVLYTPGIKMFFFSLRQYFRSPDRVRAFKNHIGRLKSWDKRWWSRLSLFIARHIWNREYEKADASHEKKK